MALPDTLLVRLIETVKEHDLGGDFLMLGRQRWVGRRKGKAARLFDQTLATHFPGLTNDDLKNKEDGYAENFFSLLGFETVSSMDISGFEGATIVQDLAGTLPSELSDRFDVIYDGGTCEHIFDLPTAYRNIHKMLKPGGTLIGHSPCNNWINHSFYQINPEMVYGFWEKAMGYEVLHLTLQPLLPNFAPQVTHTTNPNETGKRPRLIGEVPRNSPIILNYAVRKPLQTQADTAHVRQTDYAVKWDKKRD